jgi:hypothetical protein
MWVLRQGAIRAKAMLGLAENLTLRGPVRQGAIRAKGMLGLGEIFTLGGPVITRLTHIQKS